MKILITSDNHLGYKETDSIRGLDSFDTFEEILRTAKHLNADLILQGGDLFHDNRPTRYCLNKTIKLLKKYCVGESDIKISSNTHLNFHDKDISISMPILSIHGNHDDPSGFNTVSPLHILESTGFLNYIGKCENLEEINITPVLVEKMGCNETEIASKYGKCTSVDVGFDDAIADESLDIGRSSSTIKLAESCPTSPRNVVYRRSESRNENAPSCAKVAIYGLGHIKDRRLYKAFTQNKVYFNKPGNYSSYYNILIVHQNRVPRGKDYLPPSFIDSFFDLVIYGHEHEPVCIKGDFLLLQSGSTVRTSLCEGERGSKFVYLLDVCAKSIEQIPLRTVRPFAFDTIKVTENKIGNVEGEIKKRIDEMILEAEKARELLLRNDDVVENSEKKSMDTAKQSPLEAQDCNPVMSFISSDMTFNEESALRLGQGIPNVSNEYIENNNNAVKPTANSVACDDAVKAMEDQEVISTSMFMPSLENTFCENSRRLTSTILARSFSFVQLSLSPMLPLVRLRVELDSNEIVNKHKFGIQYKDKVANHNDILSFIRKKSKQDVPLSINDDKVGISEILDGILSKMELTTLSALKFIESVEQFVYKGNNTAFSDLINFNVRDVVEKIEYDNLIIDDVDEAIKEVKRRCDRDDNYVESKLLKSNEGKENEPNKMRNHKLEDASQGNDATANRETNHNRLYKGRNHTGRISCDKAAVSKQDNWLDTDDRNTKKPRVEDMSFTNDSFGKDSCEDKDMHKKRKRDGLQLCNQEKIERERSHERDGINDKMELGKSTISEDEACSDEMSFTFAKYL